MKGNMKVWIVAVATWLCLSSIQVESASKICPKKATNHVNPTRLKFDTLSFDVDEATSAKIYSSFLENLRKGVESDDSSNAIAILCERSTVVKGKEYLLVVLTSQGVTVTLALDVVNLYFVAYQIGTTTSYFFSDFTSLKTVLFVGTKQIELSFSSSYTSLPNRLNVDIGIPALRTAILTLPKYGQSGVDIQPSIVTIIEMVSEAARFTLIERTVNDRFFERIRPSDTIISYENNWETISTGIINSKNGVLPAPIQLDGPDGKPYYVTKVDQVKRNMGLLQFPTKTLTEQTLIEELLSIL